MRLLPHQQLMLDDGCPRSLIIGLDGNTPESRLANWLKNPPKSMPAFHDPRIEADRQLRAQQKKEKTEQRILALRRSKGLIDEDDDFINQTQPQENNMPRLVVMPFDRHGAPVTRGATSLPDTATPEEIEAKIQHAVTRGGKKVVKVEVKDAAGIVINVWTAKIQAETPVNDQENQTAPEADAGDICLLE